MEGEPRYRIEVVDAVLREDPNLSRQPHPTNPLAYVWHRRVGGEQFFGVWHSDSEMTILENHVLAIGRQLGYRTPDQMSDLLGRIKRAGGEWIG